MRRFFLPVLAVSALIALVVTGPATYAKLAWQLGNVSPALYLVDSRGVQAAAHYRLGNYEKADELFAKVGRGATYDRGLSLAMTGNYELAMAYFKAVLFADRFDEDARHNLALIEPLSSPVVGEAMGQGRIATLLRQQQEEEAAKSPREQTRVGRPIDARTVAATHDWLNSLQDAPGEFLKKRLKAEYDARHETGTLRQERSPW